MESPSTIFSTNSFDFSFDEPSRADPTSPWSMSLTPYKAGSMASFETNPFETSFAPNSSIKAFTAEDISVDCTPGGSHVFGKRKRALSSPGLLTPGGCNFNPLAFASVISDSKRPRFDSVDSSTLSTSGTFRTGSLNGTEDSPASSSVQTPPDSDCFPALSLDNNYLYTNVPPSNTKDDVTLDPEFSYQSILDASAPPAYQQFVMPPSLTSASNSLGLSSTASPFMLMESQRGHYASSGAAYVQPAPLSAPPASEKVDALPAATTAKGKAASAKSTTTAKGKKGKQAARAKSVSVHEEEAELGGEDEEARRKMFLERNRVAACKSRQKKKERVGYLETQASDYCARNVALQSVAVSLREEVMALRQMLANHDGCNCEHVAGYLKREAAGGGIPTIDFLAGKTMQLDYTNVPTMGSETDLYGDVVRMGQTPPAKSKDLPAAASAPAATAAAKSSIAKGTSASGSTSAAPGPAIPLRSKKSTSNVAPPPATRPQLIQVRSSSAPPVTPTWESLDDSDSYFAIKV